MQVPSSENPLVEDEFIEEQRKNLTNTQFRQEILGQFVEASNSFFTREELMNCSSPSSVSREGDFTFLGVDLAAGGTDSSVYISVDNEGNVFDIEHTTGKPMTDAMGRIRDLDTFHNYSKIVIDSTSLGPGVVDQVSEDLGNKVEGFKFTNDRKQNLYNRLKTELQNGNLTFTYVPGKNDRPANKMVNQCLDLEKSFTSTQKMRIEHPPGGHDDFSDALALAVWAMSDDALLRGDNQSLHPYNMGSLKH